MRLITVAAFIGTLAVSGCATPATTAAADPPKVIGKPVNCLQLQNIRQTRVVDDRTIDFTTRGGDVYRNTLPNSCPQLGFERAFSYQTSITQLCNVDIITVIVNAGPIRRGASCGLGKFTPIERVKRQR